MSMFDLQKDVAQNIVGITFYKRGATVLGENEGAILLHDQKTGIHCLCFDDAASGEKLLSLLTDVDCLIVNRPHLNEICKERFGITSHHPCYQGIYLGEPIVVEDPKLDIAVATDEEIDVIMQTYQFADLDELKVAQQEGMLFAAHLSGEFCGYIGQHGEGSMGMLEIFEPYRRHHLGFELEAYLINTMLARGIIPHCHIIYTNEKSMNLQKKLGITFAKDKIYWLAHHEN